PEGAGRTRLYFLHGHLFGGLYTLMSEVLADQVPDASDPERVAATVNAPLVEFLYWLLGETGEGIGADGVIERIYTDLEKGQDGRIDTLVRRAVDRLLPDGIIPGIPDHWERSAVHAIATWALRKTLSPHAGARRAPGIRSRERHQDV